MDPRLHVATAGLQQNLCRRPKASRQKARQKNTPLASRLVR
ncbi:hypothetical protein E2C01_089316 [Portunus trituberculatus]|uniref:Uncharacterized protein n=1 Tax=Portunus trituberculatus TaxID=210409 RepID=A0A5B7JBL1_PORTR|nr:hypothetical protein [Portunus trituberculatus]